MAQRTGMKANVEEGTHDKNGGAKLWGRDGSDEVCEGRQGRAHGGGPQVERGNMSDDGLNLW
jgi:hypothetical protein